MFIKKSQLLHEIRKMLNEYSKDKYEITYLFNKLYNRVTEESYRNFGYDRESVEHENRLKELKQELDRIKKIIDKL